MYRAHVNDAATLAGGQHVAHTGLRGEEGTVEMDGHHLLPVRERKAFDRMHDLDAGIADEDIHTSIGGNHFFHALLNLSLVGYIHSDGHPLALGLCDFLSDRTAARLFKSAIATLAPSCAKVRAISFPMPLAAPVTMATLSCRRMAPLALLSEGIGLLRAESRSSE